MNRTLAALLTSFMLVLTACGSGSGDDTATDQSSTAPSEDASSESSTPSEDPSDAETPSETPSETPTETAEPTPTGPACDDVWAEGGRIPGGYKGCLDGKRWVKARSSLCESGQMLVTYGDRYYGAKGSPVNDVGSPLKASDQYQQAVASCG